jgi:hypothetical protein
MNLKCEKGKFVDFDAMKTETKLKLDEGAREKRAIFTIMREDFPIVLSFDLFFICFSSRTDYESKHQECFVDVLCPFVGSIDFSYTLQAQKVDHTFSLKDLIAFALGKLSNKYRGICTTAATILKQLTVGLIKFDQDVLLIRNSEDDTGRNDDDENMDNNHWHILDTFRETLENYQEVMREFIEDFR